MGAEMHVQSVEYRPALRGGRIHSDPTREGQPVGPSIATLVQNLDRLKLDFDRHVMVHAPDPDRPMTRADLYALAKEAR
jgi:hypothetical protein